MCFNPLRFPSTLYHGTHRRHPVKKALLIAISYETNAVDGFEKLAAPHEDAESFKQLLVGQYGYKAHNVTIMSDASEIMQRNEHLAPTRENILHEISKLVDGAQPEDTFTFYFSGHCDQIESKTGSEDDGKDEVILPLNHNGLGCEEKLILDNKLRAMMVDRLPPGARLTAIFDSCHSGTLLDLDHYKCNNIYYPWVSKGYRGNKSCWQRVERRQAILGSPTGTRIVQSRKVSDGKVCSRESSIVVFEAGAGLPRRISVRSRSSSTQSQPDATSVSMGQVMDSIKQNTEENISSLDIPPMVLEEHDNVDPEFQFTIPRCTSPTPDLKCTGDYECCDSPTMKATVVSLSACNDWEIVWDTPGQYTMTKALIEVLKEDSQPVLDVLVKKVAYRLHKCAMQLHKSSGEWREQMKIERRTRQLEARSRVESDPSEFVGDEVNFWTPQVGSLKRVKMTEDHFVL